MSSVESTASRSPGRNRRKSKFGEAAARVAIRLWLGRNVYLTAAGYTLLLLVFWWNYLSRPSGRAPGMWQPPGETHPFGINGLGQDMVDLSLAGGAKSLTAGLSASVIGVGAAILLACGIVLAGKRGSGFRWLDRITNWGTIPPALAIVLLLASGTGAGFWNTVLLLALVVLVGTVGRVGRWFEELELRGDTISATVGGLTRSQVIRSNHLPYIARRGISLACSLVPAVMLGELALSFVGLGLEDGSWGPLLARGHEVIFEAPWLFIYPGLVASVSLALLGFLGWMARRSMEGDLPPRLF